MRRETWTPKGKTATDVVLQTFRANGLFLAAGDLLAAEEGLTAARWQVLGAIALAGRPLTVPQIARRMGLTRQAGQVVLITQFEVPPEDAERFLEVWADDAAFMTRQPGFISTQLHRGTAGSSTFMNVAVWESAAALRQAFRSPEFPARAARYPEG